MPTKRCLFVYNKLHSHDVPASSALNIIYILPFRLIILLLTITFCLQARATGFAQTVTLDISNAPLKKIFQEIEKQTPFRFIYTEEQLALTRPVNVQVHNMPVKELLVYCFKQQPVAYSIEDSVVIIRNKTDEVASAMDSMVQSISEIDPLAELLHTPVLIDTTQPFIALVRGRVTDEQGKPVEQATVTIKGSNKATYTDAEGNFSLKNVARNAVLIFTSVNTEVYEVNLAGRTVVGIALSNRIKQMKEVQVVFSTGYTTLNKERATGSFVKVDSELINRGVSGSILDRIYNVTNSLDYEPKNIGSSRNQSAITIRGISTINADARPLIVVDGFPYNEDGSSGGSSIALSNLNPNDVESITVLRDAAAASIWGVKSGNGVIVITTKKGSYNQKARIGFNSSFNFVEKPHLFSQPIIGPADYVELERYLFSQGAYDGSLIDTVSYPSLSPAVEILARKRGGAISAAEAEAQLNVLKNHDVRNDINKYVSQVALQQQYALNVSGGSATFNYYASLGYNAAFQTNPYNHVRSGSDRITFNLTNTFRPIRSLEISTYINYVLSGSRGAATAFSTGIPYTQLVDNTGKALPVLSSLRSTYIDTASYPGLLDWHFVPLEDPKYIKPVSRQTYARLGGSIRYQMIKGLSAEVKYQYTKGQNNSETYYDPKSYMVRNLVNSYMAMSSGQLTYPVPLGGLTQRGNNEVTSYNLRGQLNFSHIWGVHDVTAIAGAELGQVQASGLSGVRLYGYDNETGTFSTRINYDSAYRTRPAMGQSRIPNPISYTSTLNRTVSSFANAAYTFREKYTISGSARLDGSNAFGVKANQRITPLWSTGISWNISKENFYHIDWLPFLKIRATYGYQGNMKNNASGEPTIGYQNRNALYNVPYATLSSPPNLQLRWEKIRMINIGVDVTTKNERISGSIDLYYKRSIDLIGDVLVDPTVGVGSYVGNSASIKGKGLDLILNTKNIVTRHISWTTRFNLSYNTDKVIVFNRTTVPTALSYITGIPVIGKPLFALYSYRWAGLDPVNGDPRGFVKDTIAGYNTVMTGTNTKPEDLVYNGRLNPTVFGSVLNTFNLGRLQVSLNITYKLGYYFRRNSVDYNSALTKGSIHADYLLRWQKPGDEQFTSVPSLTVGGISNRTNFYNTSSILVEKGDHIRLNDIRLSYSFDRSNIKKLPLSQVQLYAYVANIGILWRANRYGLDPDNSNGPQRPQRSFAIGLNMSL